MEPLTYKKFKTGLTYLDVYYRIYNRKFKRRKSVLGYWHELKKKMYKEYLKQFNEKGSYIVSNEPLPD